MDLGPEKNCEKVLGFSTVSHEGIDMLSDALVTIAMASAAVALVFHSTTAVVAGLVLALLAATAKGLE